MLINRIPISGTKNGEIRYYSWFDPYDLNFQIYKVKVVRSWYDNINQKDVYTVSPIETIHGEYRNPDQKSIAYYVWQLQETEEDAKRLFFYALFSKGLKSFYEEEKPW